MSLKQLQQQWETEKMRITDGTLDDLPELQEIHDANPAISRWTGAEATDDAPHPMLVALTDGVPPPKHGKERFRLQSVRTHETGHLIGFLAVYHGFPDADTLWITSLAFHPRFQGQGCGTELMQGLGNVVKELETYTRMRTYVCMQNWRSLRLCVRAGFDRILEVADDPVDSDKAEAHLLLEKNLGVPRCVNGAPSQR